MKLRVLPRALRDLEHIRKTIEADDATAAEKVVARLVQSIELVAQKPDIGRPIRPGMDGAGIALRYTLQSRRVGYRVARLPYEKKATGALDLSVGSAHYAPPCASGAPGR